MKLGAVATTGMLLSGCASVTPRQMAMIGQGADVASTAYVLHGSDAQELNPLFGFAGDEWYRVAGVSLLVKSLAILGLSQVCGAEECATAWKILAGFGLGAAAWNMGQGGG